jgi:P-type Ca2+ transporter type 2C
MELNILVQDNSIDITTDELGDLVNFDKRNESSLMQLLNEKYGGLVGLARRLKTDLQNGIPLKFTQDQTSPKELGPNMTAIDYLDRKTQFGENIIPPPRSANILEILWDTIRFDPILQILIIGAVVVLALGTIICPSHGWLEGVAIVVAVLIVLAVTAGNDWSKDQKFKKLMLLQTDKKVRVIRGGVKCEMSSWDVLVGDVVELVLGDEVPADGIFISGNRLVIDESPLTGETFPMKKSAEKPFLFSGCQGSIW